MWGAKLKVELGQTRHIKEWHGMRPEMLCYAPCLIYDLLIYLPLSFLYALHHPTSKFRSSSTSQKSKSFQTHQYLLFPLMWIGNVEKSSHFIFIPRVLSHPLPEICMISQCTWWDDELRHMAPAPPADISPLPYLLLTYECLLGII